MNELYELAKQVDVIILFYIFMGFGIFGIVNGIMEIIFFIRDSIKKHKAKKQEKKESTEE